MEKKYIYRKHLREPKKFFLILISGIIIPYIVCLASLVSSFKAEDRSEVIIIILLGGVGIIGFLVFEFFLLYLGMYRRFKKIYIILTEDGIIYNNAKGEIRIAYKNIKELKFPSIKYAGGWANIIHKDGNIRLTVVLENIGEFIKTLKDNLDKKGMNTVYNKKSIYKFFKTAEYCDQSWERMYDKIKSLLIFMVINISVGAIFSVITAEIYIKIPVIIISFVAPILPFIVTEIIIGRKLAKGALKESFLVPNRDKLFENKIYNYVFGIYMGIYILGLILVKVVS